MFTATISLQDDHDKWMVCFQEGKSSYDDDKKKKKKLIVEYDSIHQISSATYYPSSPLVSACHNMLSFMLNVVKKTGETPVNNANLRYI